MNVSFPLHTCCSTKTDDLFAVSGIFEIFVVHQSPLINKKFSPTGHLKYYPTPLNMNYWKLTEDLCTIH